MSKLFLISGLGADERAFDRLTNLPLDTVMVKWIANQPNESLYDYSQRLIDQYGITPADRVAGLSFGGVVAQQIASIIGMRDVILISSFRTIDDLHSFFRYALISKSYHLMPSSKLPWITETIANYINSGSDISRETLVEMLEDTDMTLMKWSIARIAELRTPIDESLTLYNIIGTKDRIVKAWTNPHTIKIDEGSHIMVYDRGKSVSQTIRSLMSAPHRS